MIELSFVSGSKVRRIHINKRHITMITSETHEPISFDLNRLSESSTQEIIKKNKIDEQLLSELSELHTEEDIVKDITKDFQRSGWRLFKRKVK